MENRELNREHNEENDDNGDKEPREMAGKVYGGGGVNGVEGVEPKGEEPMKKNNRTETGLAGGGEEEEGKGEEGEEGGEEEGEEGWIEEINKKLKEAKNLVGEVQEFRASVDNELANLKGNAVEEGEGESGEKNFGKFKGFLNNHTGWLKSLIVGAGVSLGILGGVDEKVQAQYQRAVPGFYKEQEHKNVLRTLENNIKNQILILELEKKRIEELITHVPTHFEAAIAINGKKIADLEKEIEEAKGDKDKIYKLKREIWLIENRDNYRLKRNKEKIEEKLKIYSISVETQLAVLEKQLEMVQERLGKKTEPSKKPPVREPKRNFNVGESAKNLRER